MDKWLRCAVVCLFALTYGVSVGCVKQRLLAEAPGCDYDDGLLQPVESQVHLQLNHLQTVQK